MNKKRVPGIVVLSAALMISCVTSFIMANQAFAVSCGGQETILINCSSGSGKDSICEILSLIVRIMTTGIGILAILGVIVVGIQYLTASDNEEKLRKSKRRLLELVIGIVVYVLAGSAIQWLFLPGGDFCGINPGTGEVIDPDGGETPSGENDDNEEEQETPRPPSEK